MSLPPASREQTLIAAMLSYGNVKVDAVAGSGKTTTVAHIAKMHSASKILLLTYNKKLRFETRDRMKLLDIKNVQVHTYHSFCVKYYNRTAYTDAKMHVIFKTNDKDGAAPMFTINFDIIILDEAQDMTPTYYELVCKIASDNISKKTCKWCILGDQYQSIYEFNHADNRFIIKAGDLFKFTDYNFYDLTLSTSYRVTRQIAAFVNNCMLKMNRLQAIKDGPRPTYLIINDFGTDKLKEELGKIIKQGYSWSDIFILAPSVRCNDRSPLKKLANKLSEERVPMYIPMSDDEVLDEKILENKLVFSSFHQSKGLERKVVFIFEFNNDYFIYYEKEKPDTLCPNVMYVAATRASERLILVHAKGKAALRFVDLLQVPKCADIPKDASLLGKTSKPPENKANVVVTDLIRHLPSVFIMNIINKMRITKSNFYVDKSLDKVKIKLPTRTKQEFGYESIADINGIAIPAYHEYITTGSMSICRMLQFNAGDSLSLKRCNMISIAKITASSTEKTLNIKKAGVDDVLRNAVQFQAYTSGYNYKINQISKYDWLDEDDMMVCHKLLSQVLLASVRYEYIVGCPLHNPKFNENKFNPILTGIIDCIDLDSNTVWEFKCVGKLSNEHILQLAIYKYLYEVSNFNCSKLIVGKSVKFRSGFDILSGTIVSIDKNKFGITVGNISYIVRSTAILGPAEDNWTQYKYKLLNITTGDIIEINIEFDVLEQIVYDIIEIKYGTKKQYTDEEFISNNLSKFIKYDYVNVPVIDEEFEIEDDYTPNEGYDPDLKFVGGLDDNIELDDDSVPSLIADMDKKFHIDDDYDYDGLYED